MGVYANVLYPYRSPQYTSRFRNRDILICWLGILFISLVVCLFYPSNRHRPIILPRNADSRSFEPWPPTEEMLSAIADKHGRITVVAVNSAYIDMFYNWARSAVDSGLTNILIIALDDDAYSMLKTQFSDRTLLSPSQAEAGVAEFGSSKFNSLTSTRPAFIRAVLDLGYSVFYTDTDTIIRRNPFIDFDRALQLNPQTNVIVSEDGMKGYYCSCMLYFSCDQQSRDLLKAWERACSGQSRHDDQHAFNAIINEHLIQERLHLSVIPESRFPSGQRMFHQGYDWNRYPAGPSIIHANYLVGHDRKMQVLQNPSTWNRPNYPLALYDETVLLKWK